MLQRAASLEGAERSSHPSVPARGQRAGKPSPRDQGPASTQGTRGSVPCTCDWGEPLHFSAKQIIKPACYSNSKKWMGKWLLKHSAIVNSVIYFINAEFSNIALLGFEVYSLQRSGPSGTDVCCWGVCVCCFSLISSLRLRRNEAKEDKCPQVFWSLN